MLLRNAETVRHRREMVVLANSGSGRFLVLARDAQWNGLAYVYDAFGGSSTDDTMMMCGKDLFSIRRVMSSHREDRLESCQKTNFRRT